MAIMTINNSLNNIRDPMNRYQIKQEMIEPEFNLVYLNYQPADDHVIYSHNPYDDPLLVITIGLKGRSYFCSAKYPEVCFKANQTTVTTFSAIRGQRCYKKEENTEQLRVIVGKKVLQRYLGEQKTSQLLTRDSLKRLAYQQTSMSSLSHAHILSHGFHQQIDDPLKFHIRSLSLLAEQLSWLLPPSTTQINNKLSTQDIEKFEQVRSILLTEYQQHLTESYLCIKAGLNKTKMKNGFSMLYSTTPHQMLLDIRMQKAHSLLESGSQVTQTAWLVGYLYANNFSVAFTRYFGYSPKSVFK